MTKRLIDVVVALALLIVTAPAMAAVGVAVRLKLGSPILFRQVRPGLHAQPFTLIKFRTMQQAHTSEASSHSDEQRLTRFGRWLRATSLDELPELWNVLRGDMSLVGPRPLLMKYVPLYTAEQMRRHDVRPGITGWAQVNGRNALSWDEKFELDLWYIDNRSLSLDFKILARTAAAVFGRKGISNAGSATMPEFKGTRPQADSRER